MTCSLSKETQESLISVCLCVCIRGCLCDPTTKWDLSYNKSKPPFSFSMFEITCFLLLLERNLALMQQFKQYVFSYTYKDQKPEGDKNQGVCGMSFLPEEKTPFSSFCQQPFILNSQPSCLQRQQNQSAPFYVSHSARLFSLSIFLLHL